MAISDLTTVEEPFFSVEFQGTQNYLFPEDVRMIFTFELDDNVQIIQRDVYNIFMLLGDVGGFSGLLVSLGSFFVGILNF